MRNGDDGRVGEKSGEKGNVMLTNRTSDKWNIVLRAMVGTSRWGRERWSWGLNDKGVGTLKGAESWGGRRLRGWLREGGVGMVKGGVSEWGREKRRLSKRVSLVGGSVEHNVEWNVKGMNGGMTGLMTIWTGAGRWDWWLRNGGGEGKWKIGDTEKSVIQRFADGEIEWVWK